MKKIFVILTCLILIISSVSFFGCDASSGNKETDVQDTENMQEQDTKDNTGSSSSGDISKDDKDDTNKPTSSVYTLTFSKETKNYKASNQTVEISGDSTLTVENGKTIGDKLPKATATDTVEYMFSYWAVYVGNSEIKITKDTVFNSATLDGVNGTKITVYPVLASCWLGPY